MFGPTTGTTNPHALIPQPEGSTRHPRSFSATNSFVSAAGSYHATSPPHTLSASASSSSSYLGVAAHSTTVHSASHGTSAPSQEYSGRHETDSAHALRHSGYNPSSTSARALSSGGASRVDASTSGVISAQTASTTSGLSGGASRAAPAPSALPSTTEIAKEMQALRSRLAQDNAQMAARLELLRSAAAGLNAQATSR